MSRNPSLSLRLLPRELLVGRHVYHVANPDVAGTIVGPPEDDNYVKVVFQFPVGFSANVAAGLRTHWLCNLDLLHPSPEAARAAHNPRAS